MRKSITLSLIIIFTIGLTIAIIHYIEMKGFLFAWILNFILMICVLTFTETLQSPLSSSYYSQKNWESGGKIYESFGINLYRKLLVWIGWEKLNKKANPVNKNIDALAHLHYRTKQSEFGHLIIMFIVLGFNVYVVFKFGFIESLWLLLLNILLNVYPIFLQRYNRPRLEKTLKLYSERQRRLQNNN